jgi:hypothetical protein
MPQIGILFDIDELGGGVYGYKAYKIFFDALDPRDIPGCTITDGDTNETLAGRARHFCIALESLSQSSIDKVKAAFSKSTAKGLLPVTSRFLDEARVKREPLPLSFRINKSGDLVDVKYSFAGEALEECRKNRQQDAASAPTLTETSPRLRDSEVDMKKPRKWWHFWR